MKNLDVVSTRQDQDDPSQQEDVNASQYKKTEVTLIMMPIYTIYILEILRY